MKKLIWHLSYLSLVGIILGRVVPAVGQAQNPGLVSPPLPSTQQWGGDAKTPSDLKIPNEEERRYHFFFLELISWEQIAAKYESTGDKGWADYWRTNLERESGLTPAEAEQVKEVARQYLQDEETRQQEANAIHTQAVAANPTTWRQVLFSNQEYVNLLNKQWGLLDGARTQLVSSLGSRSFTRLDMYTLHMHDREKAAQVRKQAESSQGGAQK